MVGVVWDRCALGCYEGFCCFALGLCGLWVDVWGELNGQCFWS